MAARKLEVERLEGIDEAAATPQQKANRSLREMLGPKPRGNIFSYAARKVLLVVEILFAAFLVLVSISFLYKGVAWSQDHLPEYLHWVVLALYLTLLTLCVYLMVTEEKRREESARIKMLFGPRGMLVLPTLTLLTAASVFASVTLSLHKHGRVVFQKCPGPPVDAGAVNPATPDPSAVTPSAVTAGAVTAGAVTGAVTPGTLDAGAVNAGSLTDFYMWHFLKLVPLVKINEVMKIDEPLCYSQKRVGLLILIFQALVVLPSVNTVLYYWKHRRELAAPALDYHFEAGWEPSVRKTEAV